VRALLGAVVVMGVLIVAGVVTLAVLLVGRLSAPQGGLASVMLDEPAGTRIAGASVGPDRLAVTLQGGGADRIVLFDTKTGAVVGRVGLAR
jgi:hypothetical protein